MQSNPYLHVQSHSAHPSLPVQPTPPGVTVAPPAPSMLQLTQASLQQSAEVPAATSSGAPAPIQPGVSIGPGFSSAASAPVASSSEQPLDWDYGVVERTLERYADLIKAHRREPTEEELSRVLNELRWDSLCAGKRVLQTPSQMQHLVHNKTRAVRRQETQERGVLRPGLTEDDMKTEKRKAMFRHYHRVRELLTTIETAKVHQPGLSPYMAPPASGAAVVATAGGGGVPVMAGSSGGPVIRLDAAARGVYPPTGGSVGIAVPTDMAGPMAGATGARPMAVHSVVVAGDVASVEGQLQRRLANLRAMGAALMKATEELQAETEAAQIKHQTKMQWLAQLAGEV